MLDAVRVMQESAACAAALSLPHWVYAYTWVRPRAFASFSGVDLDRQSPAVAAKQLCTLAVGLKIVQALFFLRWWLVVVYGAESEADQSHHDHRSKGAEHVHGRQHTLSALVQKPLACRRHGLAHARRRGPA